MSGVVSCVICHEVYKPTDEIYSTSCGHVHHHDCMQNWQSRSATCPECRAYDPTSHKVFLNFEEATDAETQLINLKAQFEQMVLGESTMQHKVEALGRDLQTYQQKYFEAASNAENLEAQVEYLKVQNKSRESKIKSLTIRNQGLDIREINKDDVSIALAEKLKVCESKLKQVSAQLELEIKESLNLSMDNIKLKTMLGRYQKVDCITTADDVNSIIENARMKSTGATPKKTALSKQKAAARQTVGASMYGGPSYKAEKPVGSLTSVDAQAALRNAKSLQMPANKKQEETDFKHSIVLRGLKEKDTSMTHVQFVLMLAQFMGVKLFETEIVRTFVLEKKPHLRKRIMPQRISLVIQFQHLAHKIQFLKNKDKLRENPALKHLSIIEYVKFDTFSLFHYAKILKTVGYKHIYYNDNVVRVKKTNDTPTLIMHSKDDVDKLLASSSQDTTAEDSATVCSSTDDVSEVGSMDNTFQSVSEEVPYTQMYLR